MTEDLLIRHAAPTLAGLKTANLVNCRCDNADELFSTLSSLNRRLGSKGVRVMPLRVWDGRALVYIYRPQRLQADLKGDHAGRLLETGLQPRHPGPLHDAADGAAVLWGGVPP